MKLNHKRSHIIERLLYEYKLTDNFRELYRSECPSENISIERTSNRIGTLYLIRAYNMDWPTHSLRDTRLQYDN